MIKRDIAFRFWEFCVHMRLEHPVLPALPNLLK
jgi:hypothetical protein